MTREEVSEISTDVNALQTLPSEGDTSADIPCRVFTLQTCGWWTNPVFDE